MAECTKTSRCLIVPSHASSEEREIFLEGLAQKAQKAEEFLTGRELDYDGTSRDGIVKFDTITGVLRLNGLHPFVATFDKEFANKKTGQPLELFAMAEILVEAHLHSIGIGSDNIDNFLLERDQLLRDLASESGRQSASSVANELSNARNNPNHLEECICNAFDILGFNAKRVGKRGEPDGVAEAILSPDDSGKRRSYKVSLEAKSKKDPEAKVNAKEVNISAVIQHRDNHDCDHAIVVGPKFTTADGSDSALGRYISDDRQKTAANGRPQTITLIEVDDLANLVRLYPKKMLRLQKIRELFKCSLSDESKRWVESIRDIHVDRPRYREIIETIERLQSKSGRVSVKFAALHNELQHLKLPINYDTDDEVRNICSAMALLAPNSIMVIEDKVKLEQSASNAINEIIAVMQETV